MAGTSRHAKTNRQSENDEQKKLARLRDQRLAAQAGQVQLPDAALIQVEQRARIDSLGRLRRERVDHALR